jgi:hypothetical protein
MSGAPDTKDEARFVPALGASCDVELRSPTSGRGPYQVHRTSHAILGVQCPVLVKSRATSLPSCDAAGVPG